MSAVSDIAGLPNVQFLRKPFDIDQILELVDGGLGSNLTWAGSEWIGSRASARGLTAFRAAW